MTKTVAFCNFSKAPKMSSVPEKCRI